MPHSQPDLAKVPHPHTYLQTGLFVLRLVSHHVPGHVTKYKVGLVMAVPVRRVLVEVLSNSKLGGRLEKVALDEMNAEHGGKWEEVDPYDRLQVGCLGLEDDLTPLEKTPK